MCNVAKSPKDFGPEECNENEWQCNNRECINRDFVCDGAVDCTDKSDESPDIVLINHRLMILLMLM
jgi:Low-density lipoprotein receptor domain class A